MTPIEQKEYATRVERLEEELKRERMRIADLESKVSYLQARVEGLVILTKGVYR